MNQQQRQTFYRKRIKALENSGEGVPPPTPPKLAPKLPPLPEEDFNEETIYPPTPKPPVLSPLPEKKPEIHTVARPIPVDKYPGRLTPLGSKAPELKQAVGDQVENVKTVLRDRLSQFMQHALSRGGFNDHNTSESAQRAVQLTQSMNALADLGSVRSGKNRNSAERALRLGEKIIEQMNTISPHSSWIDPIEVVEIRRALTSLQATTLGLPPDTPPEIVADALVDQGIRQAAPTKKRRR